MIALCKELSATALLTALYLFYFPKSAKWAKIKWFPRLGLNLGSTFR